MLNHNSENGEKRREGAIQRLIVKVTGMSYQSLLTIWTLMALGFACAYFTLSSIPALQHHGPIISGNDTELETMSAGMRFLNSLYYSVITATSTGYGDIVPQGLSKLLASMQSIMALFVFAVFVTKLVSHSQELALQEVHKLTFEDIFHNTREDLYIIRKDFDAVIEEATHAAAISAESWKNLKTAFEQCQTLVAEIPKFYDGVSHLYTIDEKREKLLMEAVQRTLHRINQMLDTLSRMKIDWESQTEMMEELEELVRVVSETTPIWEAYSACEKKEVFEDILQMKDGVHMRIQKML